jgi:protein TonB
MFEDFHAPAGTEGQRRLGGSMVVALVLYCGAGAIIIGATATVGRVVEEDLGQVKFANLPPPPPPPPPVVDAQPSPRPKANRKVITTPKEVPKNTPEESEKPLARAELAGPVDGFLDGVEGGTGTARGAAPAPPPPKPQVAKTEPIVKPVALSGNRRPTYTARARRLGLEGLVVVAFLVDTNGRVVDPRIVQGPPELGEIVLQTVLGWRYRPATQGGNPIPYRMKVPVRFQES